MQTESIAVLKWIPSAVLAQGEEAVIALIEESLQAAVSGAGMDPTGTMTIRQASVNEYPHAMASRPADDPTALLHLGELHFDQPRPLPSS